MNVIYLASLKLLHAEAAVPFGDGEAAYLDHLERMEKLERRFRWMPLICTTRDPEGLKRWCNERADMILVWCNEAERWLDEAYPE